MTQRVLVSVLLLALGAVAGCGQAPAQPSPASPPASLPAGVVVELTAGSLKFDVTELRVPAGAAFNVLLHNGDRDLHNFELRDAAGTMVHRGELFSGPAQRLETVPALAAGRYAFLCTAHPHMKGTLLAD